MEEEKIISKIVDEIASNIIGKEYVFSSNDLNNNNIIQRHSDKKILVSSPVKKDKEKNDLVKRFVGKKERKSKVIINNDNIGLYLRQERDGNNGWNVHVIDLSVDDEPRIETEKFGNDYKDAEKYYSRLFFEYQFNEIKKIDDKKKEDIEKNALTDVLSEKLNKRRDKKLSLRTRGQILGEDILITLNNGNDIYYEDRTWVVCVKDLNDHWNYNKKDFGHDYNKAKKYFVKLCDNYDLSYTTSDEMEIQYKKAGGIFLVCFIVAIILYFSILIFSLQI